MPDRNPAEGAVDTRPRLRLIVEMHGGTITQVWADNDQINITDIVFTEYAKYGDMLGGKEYPVAGGALEGEIIYTHHIGVQYAGLDTFDPVIAAAEERAAAEDEEPDDAD